MTGCMTGCMGECMTGCMVGRNGVAFGMVQYTVAFSGAASDLVGIVFLHFFATAALLLRIEERRNVDGKLANPCKVSQENQC